MAKIKNWTKLPRNSNGDQWYRNDTQREFMVGVVKVMNGTHKGEYLAWILNTNIGSQAKNIGYSNTFTDATKEAVAFMKRNTNVRTI